MNSFLKHTAKDLMDKYGTNLSNYCMVFPNRRSGMFFTKYLSEITQKPIWSPKIATINELMGELSGLQLADHLTLIFELYQIYKKYKKSTETFDDFYFWGEMLLNDFNDVDKYLIDAQDLFQNLSSLKEIKERFTYLSKEQLEAIQSFWKSFVPDVLSEQQSDFIQIWTVLFSIYRDFNEVLSEKKIAYDGMIYKNVADNISSKQGLELNYNKYIFIGFNALNPCEDKLFENLFNLNKAEFYWDYDEYYTSNRFHEAGMFLRENIKKYPQKNNYFANNIKEIKKNIECIACSTDVLQSKVAGQIVLDLKIGNNLNADKAAIVLADEHLLMPVLYSIPENISEINVTMGYPVKNTPVFSLIDHLVDLQDSIRKLKNEEIQFYYKNVIKILKHQYIQNSILSGEKFVETIIKQNKIYIPQKELHTSALASDIFVKVEDSSAVSEYLLNILYTIAKNLNEENAFQGKLFSDSEYIFQVVTEIKRLQDILEDNRIDMSLKIYWRLLKKKMQNLRIPFSGEPLSGLQVMGVLETRVLDFENVVVLSLNEGVFPKTDVASSFIPYNLRMGFGLPTVEYQDAIYAYYFYRLIQRAKNVFLLYNDNTEGLKSGESSRYLKQLKYESGLKIVEKNISFSINEGLKKGIKIEKTDAVLSKLYAYLTSSNETKYFSPSALNTYLTCSLKFYFKYLAKLKEAEEVSEEVDAALFGNLLHTVMEKMYDPFIGKTIQADDLKKLESDKKLIEEMILDAFQCEYFHTNKQKVELLGRNSIIGEVLKKYVKQILKVDQQYAPFVMVGLEDHFETNISVKIVGNEDFVRLGGKIDRIDRVGQNIRIIDYKTGKVNFSFEDISSLFGGDRKKHNGPAFQTFLYALLFANNRKEDLITPGLYVTRELFKDTFSYVFTRNKNISVTNFEEVSKEYAEHLGLLLQEIFNPDVDFVQVEDKDVCKNCPYLNLCKRI